MVLIAVHGAAARRLPPERGTLHLTVALEHEDRAVAMRSVAAEHERLVEEARAHVASGAATRWSSEQVRAFPQRRYAKDGETFTIVHAATADLQVRFRDFAALSAWVVTVGERPGVQVGWIDWALTASRLAEVEREVRIEAVRDASARAEAYASAIGAHGVALERLWEPGLRSAGTAPQDRMRTMAMSKAEDAAVELRPDDIEVTAEVTADFTA